MASRLKSISPLAEEISRKKLEPLTRKLQDKKAEKEKLEKEVASPDFAKRILLKGPRQHGKTPIIIECSSSDIRAYLLGKEDKPVMFKAQQGVDAMMKSFMAWLKKHDTKSVYAVFLVKPSAVPFFYTFRQLVKEKDFDVGWEPLAEEKTTVSTVDRREGK